MVVKKTIADFYCKLKVELNKIFYIISGGICVISMSVIFVILAEMPISLGILMGWSFLMLYIGVNVLLTLIGFPLKQISDYSNNHHSETVEKEVYL